VTSRRMAFYRSGRRPGTKQPRPTAWVGGSKQSIILFHHQALKRNVPSGGRDNWARWFRPPEGTPSGLQGLRPFPHFRHLGRCPRLCSPRPSAWTVGLTPCAGPRLARLWRGPALHFFSFAVAFPQSPPFSASASAARRAPSAFSAVNRRAHSMPKTPKKSY
jgi:hypothetical protein